MAKVSGQHFQFQHFRDVAVGEIFTSVDSGAVYIRCKIDSCPDNAVSLISGKSLFLANDKRVVIAKEAVVELNGDS